MAFKVGDKVTHRSWGAGEIAFGPYLRDGRTDNYLMKESMTGNHRFVEADAMTPAAKFKVGDRVKSYGDAYTIVAGPFAGYTAWYAVEGDDGKIMSATEDDLTAVTPEPAKDEAVVNGVAYDLSARYRNSDGDTWRFERQADGSVRGTYFTRSIDEYDDTLAEVVNGYGPLTRV